MFRFLLISSDLFRFAFLVCGNAPICSDLLRFLPITNQNKSGNPFLLTPFASPRSSSISLKCSFRVGGLQKGGFQKDGFGGCSPVPKTGTRVHSDVHQYPKPERGYVRMFPGTKSRNEGTFAKTALLRNRPFLDGHFGPEQKNKLSSPPPQKISPQTPSRPLASPPPSWENPPPPPGIFNR